MASETKLDLPTSARSKTKGSVALLIGGAAALTLSSALISPGEAQKTAVRCVDLNGRPVACITAGPNEDTAESNGAVAARLSGLRKTAAEAETRINASETDRAAISQARSEAALRGVLLRNGYTPEQLNGVAITSVLPAGRRLTGRPKAGEITLTRSRVGVRVECCFRILVGPPIDANDDRAWPKKFEAPPISD